MRTSAIRGGSDATITVLDTCVTLATVTLVRRKLLGWIVVFVLGISIPVTAQISPGPLSRAHGSLSGMTDCAACHEISTGKPAFKCLECHTEIASRISARKGLHASFNITPGASLKCATCHSEHNGEDFVLIQWDIKSFDHRETGYALEGKHAGLPCAQCHRPEHVGQSERATIKVENLSQTFLGVSPSCTTCHQDQHKGQLGSNCLQCHNENNWKTIRIGKFDHSKTRYPLTGLHAEVACQPCHLPGKDKQPRYTGLAFGGCADCHSDPHRGGFEPTCQSCHSTAGWKKVSAAALGQDFDHSKTKYPLLGRHAAVDCMQCHVGGDFKKPLAFQKCMDCHRPDPHRGQFAKRIDGGECASCHTVQGFRPARFGLREHAATAYPLEGKHAAVRCAQCHIPKGTDTVFKMRFERCTDCHRDEHAGQFGGAPHFNRCDDCHTVQRLMPSTFSLVRHHETRFPITGSHVAVACGDCHTLAATFKPKPAAVYHWQNLACTTCHTDPHQGQLNALMRPAGEHGTPLGCESCHSTEAWKDFSRFDHSKTSFPLLGAHRTTPCSACHHSPNPKAALTNADFKAAPTKCEACHADVHGMQFAKAGVTPCAGCHDSAKWKPSLFDHDTRTSFALEGAHRNVGCEKCHKLTRTVGRKAVLFYRPTPTECSACHGEKVPKSGGALD